MARGRRKPIEQHVLDGTYRADRHGPLAADDQPAAAPPMPPAKLTESEQSAWVDLTDLLGGVVKPRDVPTLTELCRWVCRADTLAAALANLTPGAKGFAQLLTASAIATDKVLLLSTRFGLSPADRMRLREESRPTTAKVKTRPRTSLDDQAPPKK